MSKRKKIIWTEEMDKVILDNFGKISNTDIGKLLGLDGDVVKNRVNKIIPDLYREYRHWSNHEIEFLYNKYAYLDKDIIAKSLKRSVCAIAKKMEKMEGTRNVKEIYGFLTTPEIASIMGLNKETISRYIRMGKLSARKIGTVYHIDEDYFWKWLKENLHCADVERIEHFITQTSPKWYGDYVVSKQKELYSNETLLKYRKKYTPYEKTILKEMYTKNKPASEIAKTLNRTISSVNHIIIRMRKDNVLY